MVQCGEVEMQLRWSHVDGSKPSAAMRNLKALEQLTLNYETRLRMGDVDAVMTMLRTFPLLLNVKCVTIRCVDFCAAWACARIRVSGGARWLGLVPGLGCRAG